MSLAAAAKREQEQDSNKDRVVPTTVKRYWPGKAPDWVREGAAEESDVSSDEEDAPAAAPSAVAPPVIVKQSDDPRLRRLAERQAARDRPREVSAPALLSRQTGAGSDLAEAAAQQSSEDSDGGGIGGDVSGEEEEEEDEELLEARRAAVRERLQARQEEEIMGGEVEEEQEEGSSEYETDSEDEAYGRQLLKPVFVPKAERETIAEREALEQEEDQLYEKQQERLQERKKETKELVLERIRMEEEAEKNAVAGPLGALDINTDDEADEEAEYEAWKVRELARIRRDREEKEKEAKELEEREMLKNMTEEERRQWEREHPKMVEMLPKKKWKFMQKYWHKGAFFQDGADDMFQEGSKDEIFTRDYSAPTGEDKLDKSILPKVMQVKNFGRRGRTKWTHLVDQDTTQFDDPLAPDEVQLRKYQNKMAGTEAVFEKPRKLKT